MSSVEGPPFIIKESAWRFVKNQSAHASSIPLTYMHSMTLLPKSFENLVFLKLMRSLLSLNMKMNTSQIVPVTEKVVVIVMIMILGKSFN